MKKVSVDTVRNFLKEYKTENSHEIVRKYKAGEGTFEVRFNIDLTVDERDTFVQRVVSGSFDIFGRYHEELFEAMLHATVVQMCTNLPALALKGERTEDGQAVLDVDQMDVLFAALKLDELPAEFHEFYQRMKAVCGRAVEDRKAYLREENTANAAVRDFVYTIRDAVSKISNFATEENINSLMQYAKNLRGIAESVESEDVAEKVIALHQSTEG